MDLDQKRELQKFNETIKSRAITVTASNVTLRIIKAYGENNKMFITLKHWNIDKLEFAFLGISLIIKSTYEVKERQLVRGRAYVTLIQQRYFNDQKY